MTDTSIEPTDFAKLIEGFRPTEKPEAKAARLREEAKRDRENREWPYRASGIADYLHPDDLALLAEGRCFETPATVAIDAWVDEALEDPGIRNPRWRRALWVNGPKGLGKTMGAAKAIGRLCPWRGDDQLPVAAQYITFRRLMDLMRDGRDAHRADVRAKARESFKALVTAKLVVLDEIGQELAPDKDIARLALHDFVDLVVSGEGLVIFMSNKSADTLRSRFAEDWYDGRTESRLRRFLTRDTNNVGLHDLQGPDLRGDAI